MQEGKKLMRKFMTVIPAVLFAAGLAVSADITSAGVTVKGSKSNSDNTTEKSTGINTAKSNTFRTDSSGCPTATSANTGRAVSVQDHSDTASQNCDQSQKKPHGPERPFSP